MTYPTTPELIRMTFTPKRVAITFALAIAGYVFIVGVMA